jgi:hypothetical protein
VEEGDTAYEKGLESVALCVGAAAANIPESADTWASMSTSWQESAAEIKSAYASFDKSWTGLRQALRMARKAGVDDDDLVNSLTPQGKPHFATGHTGRI